MSPLCVLVPYLRRLIAACNEVAFKSSLRVPKLPPSTFLNVPAPLSYGWSVSNKDCPQGVADQGQKAAVTANPCVRILVASIALSLDAPVLRSFTPSTKSAIACATDGSAFLRVLFDLAQSYASLVTSLLPP